MAQQIYGHFSRLTLSCQAPSVSGCARVSSVMFFSLLIVHSLWGQETELGMTLNKQWTTIQEWLSALLAWRGLREVEADDMGQRR